VRTNDAAQADITQLPALLHGRETTLYGDKVELTRSDGHQRNPGCASGVEVFDGRSEEEGN